MKLANYLIGLGMLMIFTASMMGAAHAVPVSIYAYNTVAQDLYIQPNGDPATSDYHIGFNWQLNALVDDNSSAATLTLFRASNNSVFANFVSSNANFSFWDNNNGYDIVNFWSDSFVDTTGTYSPLSFGLYAGWDDTALFSNGLQNINQGINNQNQDVDIRGDLLYVDNNTSGIDFHLTVLDNNLQPVAVPEPMTLGLLGLGLLGLVGRK